MNGGGSVALIGFEWSHLFYFIALLPSWECLGGPSGWRTLVANLVCDRLNLFFCAPCPWNCTIGRPFHCLQPWAHPGGFQNRSLGRDPAVTHPMKILECARDVGHHTALNKIIQACMASSSDRPRYTHSPHRTRTHHMQDFHAVGHQLSDRFFFERPWVSPLWPRYRLIDGVVRNPRIPVVFYPSRICHSKNHIRSLDT